MKGLMQRQATRKDVVLDEVLVRSASGDQSQQQHLPASQARTASAECTGNGGSHDHHLVSDVSAHDSRTHAAPSESFVPKSSADSLAANRRLQENSASPLLRVPGEK